MSRKNQKVKNYTIKLNASDRKSLNMIMEEYGYSTLAMCIRFLPSLYTHINRACVRSDHENEVLKREIMELRSFKQSVVGVVQECIKSDRKQARKG